MRVARRWDDVKVNGHAEEFRLECFSEHALGEEAFEHAREQRKHVDVERHGWKQKRPG